MPAYVVSLRVRDDRADKEKRSAWPHTCKPQISFQENLLWPPFFWGGINPAFAHYFPNVTSLIPKSNNLRSETRGTN